MVLGPRIGIFGFIFNGIFWDNFSFLGLWFFDLEVNTQKFNSFCCQATAAHQGNHPVAKLRGASNYRLGRGCFRKSVKATLPTCEMGKSLMIVISFYFYLLSQLLLSTAALYIMMFNMHPLYINLL